MARQSRKPAALPTGYPATHKAYDERGEDATRKLGLKLEMKPGTLTTWFGDWRRRQDAGQAEAKKGKRRKAS